jgi:hypothetical protein
VTARRAGAAARANAELAMERVLERSVALRVKDATGR